MTARRTGPMLRSGAFGQLSDLSEVPLVALGEVAVVVVAACHVLRCGSQK